MNGFFRGGMRSTDMVPANVVHKRYTFHQEDGLKRSGSFVSRRGRGLLEGAGGGGGDGLGLGTQATVIAPPPPDGAS